MLSPEYSWKTSAACWDPAEVHHHSSRPRPNLSQWGPWATQKVPDFPQGRWGKHVTERVGCSPLCVHLWSGETEQDWKAPTSSIPVSLNHSPSTCPQAGVLFSKAPERFLLPGCPQLCAPDLTQKWWDYKPGDLVTCHLLITEHVCTPESWRWSSNWVGETGTGKRWFVRQP